MSHGGARPGAGRRPKNQQAKWLSGDAGKRGEGKQKPQPGPVQLIAAPVDLPAEQAAVWNELGPYACAQRTLVPDTVAAFRDLCEAIVLKRAMLARIAEDGMTYLKITTDVTSGEQSKDVKAHPLLSHHRGMMQRVEAAMLRFRLSPIGKELMPAEEPKDEWQEFDTPSIQ